MIVISIDGLNWKYAQKYMSNIFPTQSSKLIKNNVRLFSDNSNPTTIGLGCLWSGVNIKKFDKNIFYFVSDENRPINWIDRDGNPLDLIFNHFKDPKFYEKVAGPSPYNNYETYNKEYENVPAKKVESEEYCIFTETAKKDYELFWIHTSIIKTGVLMPGPYEQGRIPSLLQYDVIRKDKDLKKKVYEFGIMRYSQVIKYLQELANPNEIFVITSDHGTLVDKNEPLEPQIDDIPIIINRKVDLSDINVQWQVKDLLLKVRDDES